MLGCRRYWLSRRGWICVFDLAALVWLFRVAEGQDEWCSLPTSRSPDFNLPVDLFSMYKGVRIHWHYFQMSVFWKNVDFSLPDGWGKSSLCFVLNVCVRIWGSRVQLTQKAIVVFQNLGMKSQWNRRSNHLPKIKLIAAVNQASSVTGTYLSPQASEAISHQGWQKLSPILALVLGISTPSSIWQRLYHAFRKPIYHMYPTSALKSVRKINRKCHPDCRSISTWILI